MNSRDEGMDDLHDDHLRRALAHAPDHAVAPDWRVRRAILAQAHEAIGATDPETDSAALEDAARPWWRRAPRPAGAGRSRMPWNAAFATVLVAVLVGVLWLREEVPGPKLDSEAPLILPAPAPAPAPSAPLVPSSSFPTEPMPGLEAPTAPPAPPAAGIDVPPEPPNEPLPLAEKEAAPEAAAAAKRPAAPEPPADLAARNTSPARGAASLSQSPSPSRREDSAALQSAPPAPGAAPAPAPGMAAPPAAGAAGAPPAAAASAASAASAATAAAAAAAASAKKAIPTVRTDETEPPNFEALRSWNRATITRRSGETRSLPRTDARELNALLGSAALSAVGPRPLGGAPEWRVVLERNGEVQAVFEIAGAQVRWREGKMPPATGVPSGPALAALREALSDAVRPPPEPEVPAVPAQPPQAVQPSVPASSAPTTHGAAIQTAPAPAATVTPTPLEPLPTLPDLPTSPP